ncbi:UNVERIFIED_CONTAM: PiggyBac transposable element-derived protein 2 [Trichonephila clavipes]
MALIVRSSCHLARGSYDYCFNEKNEITIVKWKDNKCVTTATNCDYIEHLIHVSRHQKGLKEKSQIFQSNTVHQYNKNIGGVDQHDCLLEKHPIQILGIKWYWPIFTRIIDMAIVNTYILFNLTNCEKKVEMTSEDISPLRSSNGEQILRKTFEDF